MEIAATARRVIREHPRAAAAALVLLVAVGFGAAAHREIHRPYQGFDSETFVQIAPGTPSEEIARLLTSRGVIRHPWLFYAIRVFEPRRILHAGEYRFAEAASARRVFERLARGDVFFHRVTIPEGANMFEVAGRFARLDWLREDDILQVVRSPGLIADLDPAATSLEGYLFPSTYLVTRGASARDVCRMMTDEFRRVWRGLAGTADVRETVTLASLVEKETAVPAERPQVAGVYRNRLERGMRLECDPTVIYAALLEGKHDGVIHRSDLARPHPYNTYRRAGLPPGPIANPGRAAIEAVLRPADTDYLFFVARPDGSGTHKFSETITRHNRAVREYRRGVQQAKRQSVATRVSERGYGGGH
jgi:UPF0755 protein